MSKLSPNTVILGLLAVESCHGYQLLDHFRDANRLASIWNLSTSQLYATLKRLEHHELIDGREESSVDAPIRTVYWLTDKGKAQLNEWLNDPYPSASTRAIRTEFLSRLYLCRLLNHPTKPIITAQKTSCETHRQHLIERRDSLSAGVGHLSLDLRVREMSIIMNWLENAETMFSHIKTN